METFIRAVLFILSVYDVKYVRCGGTSFEICESVGRTVLDEFRDVESSKSACETRSLGISDVKYGTSLEMGESGGVNVVRDEFQEIEERTDLHHPTSLKGTKLEVAYSSGNHFSTEQAENFLKMSRNRGESIIVYHYDGPNSSNPNEGTDSEIRDENGISNETPRNYCHPCNVAFRFHTHYKNHCQNIHGFDVHYRCHVCKNDFTSKSNLQKHARNMHGVNGERANVSKLSNMRQLTCDVCDIVIRGMTAFEKHALSTHKEVKMMACAKCPMKFYRRNHLLKHEWNTHRESNLKCVHCKNIFGRTDVLKDHEKYCEMRQINKRRERNEVDKSIEVLESKCGECFREFQTSKRLKEHYSSEHPDVKFYGCEYCGVTYRLKFYLDKHLDMEHPEEEKYLSAFLKHRKGKLFICEYCGGEFQGLRKYEQHGPGSHPGQPMFRCQVCGKGYNTRKGLKWHIKESHSDDKTRCSYCPKCFHSSYQLKRHEASCRKVTEKIARLKEEGELGHYCEVCDQNLYVTTNSFRIHRKNHEKYERCKLCKQGFDRYINPNGLANHMQRRHPLNDNINALLRTIREESIRDNV